MCPRRESNPRLSLRSAQFYPLNYRGVGRYYTKFFSSSLLEELGGVLAMVEKADILVIPEDGPSLIILNDRSM